MDAQALQQMLGGERDGAMLRLTLARALLQQQQAEAAIEHLQQALVFDPDYTAAWKLLGQVHNDLGQHNKALQAWQKGVAASSRRGDQQTGKELQVFIRRLHKQKT